MEQPHLIILAAGKATRMLPIHQNCYPKILCNLGNEVQIQKMLNKFPEVRKRTILVSDNKQALQVNEMLQALDITDVNIEVLYCGPIGTLKTLEWYCNNTDYKSDTKNVIISWSDICPVEDIVVDKFDKNIIFADLDQRHRFGVDDFGQVMEFQNQKGNIPGLYYVKDLDELTSHNGVDDGTDLVESFIDMTPDLIEVQYENFVDVGDLDKYTAYIKDLDIKQRFFNDVKIGPKTVTKRALTKHGLEVMKHEKSFYDLIKGSPAEKSFPQVLETTEDGFVMERFVGHTVHESLKWVEETPMLPFHYTPKDLYDKFCEMIGQVHNQTHVAVVESAVHKEYVKVPFERYNKIKNILPIITNVNGTTVDRDEAMNLIVQLGDKITTNFTLIHGDPNTSNVMYDHRRWDSDTQSEIEVMQCIDPRGQFGGNKFYGDPLYDHAKFLYGLSGYDDFNLTKDLRFTYSDGEIYFDDNFGTDLDTLTEDTRLKYLVALIWFKLPYYTINNINKAIVSYAKGLQMITKYGNQLLKEL